MNLDYKKIVERIGFIDYYEKSNRVYLVEFWDGYKGMGIIEIENVEKSLLLSSQHYITYNIKSNIYNKKVVKDFIIKYTILDRIVDDKAP